MPSWASGDRAALGLGRAVAVHGPLAAATDLLEKILELDVDKRLTATQALAHPFFEPIRDPEEETVALQPFDDSLEHERLTVDEWKRKPEPRPLPATSPLHPSPPTWGSFLLPALAPCLSLSPWGCSLALHPSEPPDPPPPAGHIYKEIVNFSPIARKDSRRRSGLKL